MGFYLGISHILEPWILKVLKFNELNVFFFFKYSYFLEIPSLTTFISAQAFLAILTP